MKGVEAKFLIGFIHDYYVACCGEQVAPNRLQSESLEISLVISVTLHYVLLHD